MEYMTMTVVFECIYDVSFSLYIPYNTDTQTKILSSDKRGCISYSTIFLGKTRYFIIILYNKKIIYERVMCT